MDIERELADLEDVETIETTKKYFAVLTYGCQMNESDSEKFALQLKSMGYRRSPDIKKAGIILINTCCVRESAEKKIAGKIGELKHLKRANPDLLLIIAGCWAQKEQDKLLKKFSHIDLVIGTHNINMLSDLITRIRSDKKRLCQTPEGVVGPIENHLVSPEVSAVGEKKISAWVPIMYGCDNFCTYCIVPYVRGRERSRPPEDILEEIRVLGQNGYKEITLLGQNVNSYGADNSGGVDFADLLAAADKIETIDRIRYMTSHPRDMSGKIIQAVADSNNPVKNKFGKAGKICQHFHLPVQSGSNKILAAMNRGYTTEYYRNLVSNIRQKIVNPSITTDIIVGFPGETDELFAETLEFIKEIGFDAAFTFIYSKRSGTPAADYAGQVPLEVKKIRLKQLSEVQNAISLAINKNLEGSILEVLIEGPSKNDSLKYTGRTRTNKIVVWDKTGREEPGGLADIEIIKAQTWLLKGRIVV